MWGEADYKPDDDALVFLVLSHATEGIVGQGKTVVMDKN